MRILENILYSRQVFNSFFESSVQNVGSPLLGRIGILGSDLFLWVQERCRWVRNFFLNLLWPAEKVEKAQSTESLREADPFREICKDPYRFYDRIQAAGQDFSAYNYLSETATFRLGLGFFKLCPCKKAPPPLRIALENAVIDQMQKIHRNKSAPITIVSVGAGGFYQEVVYLVKLVEAGYEKITFIAIDSDPAHSGMSALSDFCKEGLKSKVDAEHPLYLSLESYQEEAKKDSCLKPDLMLCIDLSDERFNVDGKPLADHAFSFFQRKGILREKTIIAHSFLEIPSVRSSDSFICKAVSVQNTPGVDNLHELEGKREFQIEYDQAKGEFRAHL